MVGTDAHSETAVAEKLAAREHPAMPRETSDFDESLVAAFERTAMTFPSRVALGSDGWRPTYRELNETANRLAHRLIDCGGGLGDRAAILMAHDSPMVAAVLGIVKAGQIVVALNPDDPVSQLKTIVEDAEPSVIVTDAGNRSLSAEIAQSGCRILDFDSEAAIGTAANPSIEIPPRQTAVLVYTSGTTGRPKGVMKTHRQLRRAAAAHTDCMQSTEHDRIPLFASISTGQGASFLWWVLLNGAMLCPFPVKTRGVSGLGDWIVDRGLTVYGSSASIFRTLVKTIDDRLVFSNVRAVWLASEGVTTDDFKTFRKHFPRTSVLAHGLSSSETSILAWSRWAPDYEIPEGVLPVGHFSKDMEISLIADDGQPAPRGEVGDIVVKSRYVADGYWRDPKLTAERFSPELDGDGTRLVRTGDLGRINADGLLVFCGRKDDRIKIRGNRIELVEIDRALESLPGIDRAAALVAPRENHEPLLVACVVKKTDAEWTAPQLRHALRTHLPLHMVPSRIVFLDSIPYNRGNKVDREALRHHALSVRDEIKSEGPQTETEVLLANTWAETLELSEIGREDDFFDLGGDSLKGTIVAAQVHAALDVELSLGQIVDHPTIASLATFIDECRRLGVAARPPIVRVPRAASIPLSFQQEAFWPHCGGPECTHVLNYRIVGPLDLEIYKKCLSHLHDRHEVCRTTFCLVEGRPVQVIHPAAPLDFSFIDLTDCDDPEGQADAIFREAASRAINLEKLPITRHVLIKIAHDHHRLARVNHMLLTDGFSSRVFEAELAILYQANLQGREPSLPRRAPLQYADYTVWQRQVFRPDGAHFKKVLDWWKTLLAVAQPATRLPFRRLSRRMNLDPGGGALPWMTEEQTAKRLDEIAHQAGTTHFIIRLAAFAALFADMTGNSTVAFWTNVDNRNRADARTIVGLLLNRVPLVFSYDASKTFLEWLEIVHNRVFETIAHSEFTFDKIREQLQTMGIKPPESGITFMLARDNSDQHFENLVISIEAPIVGTMPSGCTVYLDEEKAENCRLNFDAGLYRQDEMRAMLDRYVRLLDTAARAPELPMGQLLTMIGAKPVRWMRARYAAPFYDFLDSLYVASPLLKMFWRPMKRWLRSSG